MARPSKQSAGSALAPVAAAALAVLCCAGLPLVLGLAGSVALGTLFGVGAGVAAALLGVGALIVRRRGQETSVTEERHG